MRKGTVAVVLGAFRPKRFEKRKERTMKKLTLLTVVVALGMFGLVNPSTAIAGQPKTDVAHCGCNADGSDLEWVYLSVSTKSKGHKQHDAGDLEDCDDEFDEFVDTYERDFDDCILFNGAVLDGVVDCAPEDPIEGDSCSD